MPEHGDGLISKYINRPLSKRLTKCILHFSPNCNPNLISICSAVVGIIGAILFAIEIPIIAAILVQASSIIDGSDGEVARANKRASFYGGFFDSVIDRYVDSFVILGLIFFSLNFLPLEFTLFLGMLTLSGSFLISYTAGKVESKDEIDFSRTFQGRDTRLFLIFLAGILTFISEWTIPVCMILISIMTHSSIVLRIRQVKKQSIQNQ